MPDHIMWQTIKSFPTYSSALHQIERLQEVEQDLRMLLEQDSCEIVKLKEERNAWQATSAGLSQDLSNAEDDIEIIKEKNESLLNEIKILKKKNQSLHLDLLTAYSEIDGLYNEQN
jgi:chromosome segregation ATPase